jgi:cold-inducible RNA-binding protein
MRDLCSVNDPFLHIQEYVMTKKLYVGNFSYATTEAQIRELFVQAGEVDSVALITDRETGRAKGFGFVEMNTEEGSREAIKRFNGYTLDERNLTVNEARPREERSNSGFGSGSRDNHSSSNRRDSGYTGNRNRF